VTPSFFPLPIYLDIFRMKDDMLDGPDLLPPPDEAAAEIAESPGSAPGHFRNAAKVPGQNPSAALSPLRRQHKIGNLKAAVGKKHAALRGHVGGAQTVVTGFEPGRLPNRAAFLVELDRFATRLAIKRELNRPVRDALSARRSRPDGCGECRGFVVLGAVQPAFMSFR
jgi:hypothetical protein